jgi:hypothetical protein
VKSEKVNDVNLDFKSEIYGWQRFLFFWISCCSVVSQEANSSRNNNKRYKNFKWQDYFEMELVWEAKNNNIFCSIRITRSRCTRDRRSAALTNSEFLPWCEFSNVKTVDQSRTWNSNLTSSMTRLTVIYNHFCDNHSTDKYDSKYWISRVSSIW